MNINKIMLSVNPLKLWMHQKDAIETILDFLSKPSDKSHLVKMPTGTGKTGVFSVLSRIALPQKNFLIVVPSTALKFQTIDEIAQLFWPKIEVAVTSLGEKQVEGLLPTTVSNLMKDIDKAPFVYVTTIQALQTIFKDYPIEYSELKSKIDIVIFDEGHKEPAHTWSETIREFNKPTILFSATPYRNDLKLFNLNKEKFFNFGHADAESKNILRKLEIRKLRPGGETPVEFVNELLSKIKSVEKDIVASGVKSFKTIIKCKTGKQVRDVVAALTKVKKRAVGIHERFPDKDNLLKEVPPLAEHHKYDFFVHQHKLVEGIDNSEFAILAIYQKFTNSREFIQQVGRILRNPTLSKDQKGYVFTVDDKFFQEEWDTYLKYDKELQTQKKLFDISDVLSINKDVSTLYFDGTFRELIDVTGIDLSESILFQSKANIYINVDNQSLDEIASDVIDEWGRRDYQILKTQTTNDGSYLLLYIIYSNSPLVKKGLFIEQKLAVTFIKTIKNFIYFYDSEFNNPFYYNDGVQKIPSDAMLKLLNKKTKLTKINLMNSDIGNSSIRSKEINAPSIEDTAPMLGDHMYFLTRVQAYVNEGAKNTRRYVGLQNSRLSDFSAGRIEHKEYLNWLNSISTVVHSSRINVSEDLEYFLSRHADMVENPTDVTPISILIDCDETMFTNYRFDDEVLSIDEFCAEVKRGEFDLKVNGEPFTVCINYDNKYKRYNLECTALEDIIKPVNESDVSFFAYLNSLQAFRIITEGNLYVYAYKNFYSPRINITGRKQKLDLKTIITAISAVTAIGSEKGNAALPADGSTWHKNTLFGMVSRKGIGYHSKALEKLLDFDYIVCDDLESEICDFIGISEKDNKISFIHAKAGDNSLSASAFHVVCSQAMKNLDYLNPFYGRKPIRNVDKWKKNWSVNGVGNVKSRVQGGITAEKFWSKYQEMMRKPSVKKEVIILMGKGFDYAKFKAELNKTEDKIAPQVVQIIFLLRSTWASVASIGGELKIIC